MSNEDLILTNIMELKESAGRMEAKIDANNARADKQDEILKVYGANINSLQLFQNSIKVRTATIGTIAGGLAGFIAWIMGNADKFPHIK